MKRSIPVLVVLLTAAALHAVPGCGDRPAESGEPGGEGIRIVSLSPAISRALVDVGVADRIVGRTPYCTMLDPGIPVAGDLVNIDYERLLRLRPTHVLVQPSAAGVDRRLAAMAEGEGWQVAAWRLNTIVDIRAMTADLPTVLFASAAEPGRTAVEQAAGALTDRLDRVLRGAETSVYAGRVLLVCYSEPVTVFGRTTYLDDVLSTLGARNAAEATGWAQLTVEDVIRMDPDAMILVTDRVDEPQDPAAALGVLGRIDVAAVREGRLAVLAHEGAMMPSTSVVEVARELRTILERFARSDS